MRSTWLNGPPLYHEGPENAPFVSVDEDRYRVKVWCRIRVRVRFQVRGRVRAMVTA